MAVEINSKNLHKHALPLLIVTAIIIGVSAISLSQYRVSVSRGLEALFGQSQKQEIIPGVSNLGSEADNYDF